MIKPKHYSLARRLAAFRIDALELTQNELAEISGVSALTISAFENGRSTNIQHMYIYGEACHNDRKLMNEFMGIIRNSILKGE